jgi:hypothetical protein
VAKKRQVVRVAPGGVTVTPVPKQRPDLDQYVAALLAMSIKRLSREKMERDKAATKPDAE